MSPKIIKGDLSPVVPRGGPSAPLAERKVIDREIFDARKRAEQIAADVAQLIQRRRSEGAVEAQATYQAALAAGADAARLEVARRALESFRQRGQALRGAIGDCLTLGKRLCAKVFGDDIGLDRAAARGIAEEVMREQIASQQLILSLAAEEMDRLALEAPRLLEALAAAPELSLRAGLLGAGVMRLTVAEEVLDVSLDAMLPMLREALGVPAEAVVAVAPAAAREAVTWQAHQDMTHPDLGGEEEREEDDAADRPAR